MSDEFWKDRIRDAVRSNAETFCKDLTKARVKALTYTKPCPSCKTKQVQLVLYGELGCEWKCRHCKEEWRINYD